MQSHVCVIPAVGLGGVDPDGCGYTFVGTYTVLAPAHARSDK